MAHQNQGGQPRLFVQMLLILVQPQGIPRPQTTTSSFQHSDLVRLSGRAPGVCISPKVHATPDHYRPVTKTKSTFVRLLLILVQPQGVPRNQTTTSSFQHSDLVRLSGRAPGVCISPQVAPHLGHYRPLTKSKSTFVQLLLILVQPQGIPRPQTTTSSFQHSDLVRLSGLAPCVCISPNVRATRRSLQTLNLIKIDVCSIVFNPCTTTGGTTPSNNHEQLPTQWPRAVERASTLHVHIPPGLRHT